MKFIIRLRRVDSLLTVIDESTLYATSWWAATAKGERRAIKKKMILVQVILDPAWLSEQDK